MGAIRFGMASRWDLVEMSDLNAALRARIEAHRAQQHQSPAEAGQAWLESTPEAQRHRAVVDRLGRLEAMVLALLNRFGVEVHQ